MPRKSTTNSQFNCETFSSQLQDAGRWVDAATLAATHLQGSDHARSTLKLQPLNRLLIWQIISMHFAWAIHVAYHSNLLTATFVVGMQLYEIYTILLFVIFFNKHLAKSNFPLSI